MDINTIGNWLVRSLPETIIIFWFVTVLLNKKLDKKIVLTSGFILSLFSGILPAFLPSSAVGMSFFTSFLGSVLLAKKFINDNLLKTVIMSACAMILLTISDLISALILSGIFGIPSELFQGRPVWLMALSTIGLLSFPIAAKIITSIRSKKQSKKDVETEEINDEY